MFFQIIRDNLELFITVSLASQLILLILVVWLTIRTSGIISKFKLLLKGTGKLNLEDTLVQTLEKSTQNEAVIDQLTERQREIKATLMRCVQNKSVIRFNAFDNLGGDLSFAVALLDEKGDGMVISGLYGRDDTRVYAKPVQEGKSTHLLSDEENKAISDAMIKNR
ncbi:MAG TPA: DUF4446 family protein [Bacillota bacterium]|nr:DUF4446 family protein [Bacillota bacterium]